MDVAGGRPRRWWCGSANCMDSIGPSTTTREEGGGGGLGGKVAKDLAELGTLSLDFKLDRTVRGKMQTSIIAFSISTSKQLPLAPFAHCK